MKNAKNILLLQENLVIKSYSESTQTVYLSAIKEFFSFFPDKDGKRITTDEARQFLIHKIQMDKISISYQKQLTSAIRMYFEDCLGRQPQLFRLPNPRRNNKIPNVLEPKEVQKILNAIENLKHRTLVALMYSCGLRVSEVCKLKVGDIDSVNMSITIHEAKWNKDRKVMLDKSVLDLLRKYWIEFKPKTFLFEGRDAEKYSSRSVQLIVKEAAKKAGITKHISTHTFRHSCFTTLLKSGTDLMHIKELAGHKYLSTTEKYLHIAAADVLKIKSPISSLKLNG